MVLSKKGPTLKILCLDCETSPNTAYVWSIWKETIPLARLIETSELLCFTAKWYGEKDIFHSSLHNETPLQMLYFIHDLLHEADVVVHYNGSNFDIPVLNREFLRYNINPPSPYKQIDLLQTVRRNFRFTSNKLDHVCKELDLGQKKETSFQLWVDCMKGLPDAWKLMKEYNIHDVVLLEKLYEKLLPWLRGSANHGLYQEDTLVCPNCGSKEHHKRGFAYTASRKYQRYNCTNCGNWFRSNKCIPSTQEKFQNVT